MIRRQSDAATAELIGVLFSYRQNPGALEMPVMRMSAYRLSARIAVTFCAIVVSVGCQSTKLGQLPGMSWMASGDKPPVLDSDSQPASYPPPSAAAVPRTITDATQTAASQTNSQTPAANEIAQVEYPDTELPGVPTTNAAATTSVPTTPTNSVATIPTSGPPNTALAVQTASTQQLAVSASAAAQQGLYPTSDSGTATTWDYPPAGTSPPSNAIAGANGSDFPSTPAPTSSTATAAAATANTVGDFTTAPPVDSGYAASALGGAATDQSTQQASHYASIAQASQTGPWRPGSTTNFTAVTNGQHAGAAAAITPQTAAGGGFSATVPTRGVSTAAVPASSGSGSRHSGWE
jgi:hypothetical protein